MGGIGPGKRCPSLFIHQPGQKWLDIPWRFAAILSTGMQIERQPVAWVDAPKHQGLQDREECGGQLCTPDASRACLTG